ncbi:MAG: ABC transporter substrate-binding protein, partial [Dehalococcoidia bacterium]
AEVFVLVAIPKYAALALKAAADQGWKPNVVMTSVAVDQSLFALAGGPQNVEGVISDDFSVPAESGDPSIQPVKDLLDKYAPNTQLARFPVNGYIMGQMMVDVLKRAGVNPTRQSLLDAAESFKDYSVPQLVPGIKLNSSKTDHYLIKSVKLLKAQGGKFVYFGDVLSG